MLKVKENNEYKNVDLVYSGETEIEQIYDKNGNLVFDANNEIEDETPISFQGKKSANLKNYRIFGNSVEQVISNNLFYKVISGAGMQTDGTIKSDSSYNMLFAKIIPGQDYIAAKGEVNSTALTYTLYNVYDHDPDIGSQALLPSWKSTNNNGIINYTGDTPVYLGLRVPASTAFPHLNIGTTIYDYDDYEASITGVGDKVTDSQYLIPVTITNGADTQTTNLYLPEPLKMVGDEAEYIDYAEQKQHRVRKNYLQSSDFEGGAIFTGEQIKNKPYQSSKTSPGTLNYDSTRKRSTNLITIIGTYTISIADGWEFAIVMFPDNKNSGVNMTYNTEPVTISNCTFAIQIKKSDLSDISSADISDYKIVLNKGSTALQYEPYIENTEVDVTLPALPTIAGANVLTVGTEAQPSKVEIKGKIKAV